MLELMAALFVLSVGLFGAVQMYHVGTGKLKALHETSIALAAIENEMETLRALPFAALQNTDNGPFLSETPALAQLVKPVPKVVIANYSPDCPGLKQVTVSVRWIGEHGRTIEKSVTTLIADKGARP